MFLVDMELKKSCGCDVTNVCKISPKYDSWSTAAYGVDLINKALARMKLQYNSLSKSQCHGNVISACKIAFFHV